MSPCEQQMRCYEEMLPLTEHMLVLARGEQWAGLGPLEARFSALADELRQLPPCDPVLTPAEGWPQRRAQLHARVQANHGALREIILPELARLAAALRSMEWQQSLHQAYSQPGRALL